MNRLAFALLLVPLAAAAQGETAEPDADPVAERVAQPVAEPVAEPVVARDPKAPDFSRGAVIFSIQGGTGLWGQIHTGQKVWTAFSRIPCKLEYGISIPQ